MQPILAATAVDSSPAAGAAIWEVVIATVAGVGATLLLLALAWAHRSGRTRLLRSLADFASRSSGLPYWAALPTAIVAGSLIVALTGMYWDISLHVGTGRDAGPFANPAHFLILAGLFGVFAAGLLAMVLPDGRHGRAFVRMHGDWYAPLGSIGLLVAAGFSLTGFPLDDVWHRIFGQDVTLWGPTHLMLIGGAALAFIGQATLLGEAKPHEVEVEGTGLAGRIAPVVVRFRYAALAGGFLIGLSTFQAEFDFGVPQFAMMFEPVMLAFAAGVALTAARIYGGPGSALFAAGFFVVVRGLLALLVGPVLGEPTPYLPLYLAEAGLVELAALAIDPRARSYAFGALSGALIGTVGFAAEFGWSQIAMPVPWTGALIGEALVATVVVAVASGVLGAFIAVSWLAPIEGRNSKTPRLAPAIVGLGAIVAVVGYGLQTSPERGVAAEMSLREASPAPERTVNATVRFEPASAAADAHWVSATAWQGDGFHLDHLSEVAPGVYETNQPMPVHGTWKAMIRLHRGDSIAGVPVYMPRDSAIPAAEVPARPEMTRELVADSEILQREQLDSAPGYLETLAYAAVGGIVLAVIVLLGWSLRRLSASAGSAPPPRRLSGRRPGLRTRPARA